jgi:hypothetical protein
MNETSMIFIIANEWKQTALFHRTLQRRLVRLAISIHMLMNKSCHTHLERVYSI